MILISFFPYVQYVYYYYVCALLLSVCFCPDTFLIGLLLSILFPSTVFYSLQLSCYYQCVPRTYTYWRKPLKLVARPWQPYPSTLSVDFVTFCAVYTVIHIWALVLLLERNNSENFHFWFKQGTKKRFSRIFKYFVILFAYINSIVSYLFMSILINIL